MGGKKSSKKKKGAPRNKEESKLDGYKKEREEVTLDMFLEYFRKSDEKKRIDIEGKKAIGDDDDPSKKGKEKAIQIEESTATPITMAEKDNNLPSPSLPRGYVTLNMLQERYSKAQEQKRLDSERQEQEKDNNLPSPSLPQGYVTLNMLQERYSKVQEQKRLDNERQEQEKDNNLPSPSLPQGYVTLNMLQERYSKAQEQKRLDNERQEQEKDNNLPSPSLPQRYVTLNMLQERYYKAQEQKRLDSERQEQEKDKRGNINSKRIEKEVSVQIQKPATHTMTVKNDNNLPSRSLDNITLNMIRDHYLKAEEQKLMYHANQETKKAGQNDGDLDKKGKKAAVWAREAHTSKMISRNNDNLPWPPLSNHVSLSMFHERHLKAQEPKCIDTDEKKERKRAEGNSGNPDKKWNEMDVLKEEAASSRMMAAVTDSNNLKLPALPDGYVTLNMLRERYLKAQEMKRLEKEAKEKEAAVKEAVAVEVKSVAAEAVERDENRKKSKEAVEEVNRVAEAVEQGGNWKNSWKVKEVKSLDSMLIKQVENQKNSLKSKEVKKSVDAVLIKQVEDQKNIWRNSWKLKEAVSVKSRAAVVVKQGENRKNGGKLKEAVMVEGQGESVIVEEVGGEGGNRKNWRRRVRRLTGMERKERWRKNQMEKAIKAMEALAREEIGGGESEKETVVDANGRVWVKKKVNPTTEIEGGFRAENEKKGGTASDVKVPSVVVNPTAEIEEKFRHLSVKNGGARNGQDYLRGGNERKGGKARDVKKNVDVVDDPMAENERNEGKARDVKVNVNVVDDATAESGLQSGDSSRNKKKRNVGKRFRKNKVAENGVEATDNLNIDKEVYVGMGVGKNVEDDATAENGRRNGGYGRTARGGGSVKGYKGKGRANRGKMQLDSSLVWVRKEDKADACVAGNCLEGVLEKAGEKEKKPGRGRA